MLKFSIAFTYTSSSYWRPNDPQSYSSVKVVQSFTERADGDFVRKRKEVHLMQSHLTQRAEANAVDVDHVDVE